MIVKNEAHVIKRCLGSVKPWIDHWTIVDTGSNDGTQSLVREVLCDIPGSLFERPWIDFSVNRSESIALASPFSDYLLIIDADDTLEVESKFAFPLLSRDAYTLTVHDAGHLYRRLHIIRTSLPWRYEGVLHQPCHAGSLYMEKVFVEEDGDRGANRILTKQRKNMHALWDQLLGDEFTLNGTRKRIVEITGDADLIAKARFAISTSGGIEHVYPQTPGKPWAEAFKGVKSRDKVKYAGSLGNMLLLSASVNSALQNDGFDDKKHPKHNEEGEKVRNGFSDGSHSEIEVSKLESWGPQEIRDRGIKLLKFMEKRWGLQFANAEGRDSMLFLPE